MIGEDLLPLSPVLLTVVASSPLYSSPCTSDGETRFIIKIETVAMIPGRSQSMLNGRCSMAILRAESGMDECMCTHGLCMRSW